MRCAAVSLSQGYEFLAMPYPSQTKLKAESVVGSVAIAAVFAALSGSSVVFIVVAGALIANSMIHSEDQSRRIEKR